MSASVINTAMLVRCTGPDPKTMKTKHRSFFTVDAGKTSLSCSGFVAAPDTVITSAWLIAPFLSEPHTGALIFDTKIDCCGEDGVWRKAELVHIWRGGERLGRAVRELTGSDDELNIRGICQYDLAVLSCDTTNLRSIVEDNQARDFFQVRSVDRGTSLQVVSSAFGLVSPTVFRNSITRGVLSNVFQSGAASTSPPDLCLTDARCLAGSEGAPVFDNQGRFVGVVLPCLVRRDGNPIELGAIVPYEMFLSECLKIRSSHGRIGGAGSSVHGGVTSAVRPSAVVSTKKAPPSVPSKAAQSVALIRVGVNWGSGVLVHKDTHTGDGIVLTCAHVVKSHMDTAEAVMVSFRGCVQPVERMGIVKYCCEGPVDIAFVAVSRLPPWLDVASLVTNDFEISDGDEVSAVGHAIFEPSGMLGRNATISRGALSRVVPLDGRPALLQTCAQVYRGHSGGMICDDRGRLVGIITSNAKHSDGSIIPEINFAVPLCYFKELLAAVGTMSFVSDAKTFDDKTKANQQLKMLWALQPVENIDLPPRIGGGNFYNFFARFIDSKL